MLQTHLNELRAWIHKHEVILGYMMTALLISIGLLLIVFGFSSCAPLGIATTEDLNKQIEGVQDFAKAEDAEQFERVVKGVTAATRPLDVAFPGTSAHTEAAMRGSPYQPQPRVEPLPDTKAAWVPEAEAAGEIALYLLGLYAVYRKSKQDARVEVNQERDMKRASRGEALTVQEALQKGYFEDGVKRS